MESPKETQIALSKPSDLETLPEDLKKEILALLSPRELALLGHSSKNMPTSFANLDLYLKAFNIYSKIVQVRTGKDLTKLSFADLLAPEPLFLLLLKELERNAAFNKIPQQSKEKLRAIAVTLLFFARIAAPEGIIKLGISGGIVNQDVLLAFLSGLEIVQTYIDLRMDKNQQQPFLDALYAKVHRELRETYEVTQPALYGQNLLRLMAICNQPIELFPTKYEPQWQISESNQTFLKKLFDRSWGRNSSNDLHELRRFIQHARREDYAFCLYALRHNKQFSTETNALSPVNISNTNLEKLLRNGLKRQYYALAGYILQNFNYPQAKDRVYTIGFEPMGPESLVLGALQQDDAAFSVLSAFVSIELGHDRIPSISYDGREYFCLRLLTNPGLELFTQNHPEFWRTEFGGLTPGSTLASVLAKSKPSTDTRLRQRRMDMLAHLAANHPETLLQKRVVNLVNGDERRMCSVVEELMFFTLNIELGNKSVVTAQLENVDRYLDTLDYVLKHLRPVQNTPICQKENLILFFKHLDNLYAKQEEKKLNSAQYHRCLRTCIMLLDRMSYKEREICLYALRKPQTPLTHLKDIFTALEKAYRKIGPGFSAHASNSIHPNKKAADYRALLDEFARDTPNGDRIEALTKKIKDESHDKKARSALGTVKSICLEFARSAQSSSSSVDDAERPAPK